MNKLLHHLHSSIQLIQSQNILLSKQPQPRALPKILSKKERFSEEGETCLRCTLKLWVFKRNQLKHNWFHLLAASRSQDHCMPNRCASHWRHAFQLSSFPRTHLECLMKKKKKFPPAFTFLLYTSLFIPLFWMAFFFLLVSIFCFHSQPQKRNSKIIFYFHVCHHYHFWF